MDFDESKENIQPLAAGRNASILHASLRLESPQDLLNQRRQLEEQITNYVGDDPLEVWYHYISWIEQSFPSGGKESGLDEVLAKCLGRFEGEKRYYQDRRMIKLFIKFIDSHQDPTECYQQLFDAGIGTMIADLYISWAYHYDLSGNHRRADEIFRRGIACRAQPLDDLIEAQQHYGFSVSQRIMYQDDKDLREDVNKQLQDRRLALTSLRGHRRKADVGSVRTGAAVKNLLPGIVKTEPATTSKHKRINEKVKIFNDENNSCNVPTLFVTENQEENTTDEAPQETGAVIRSIINAARNQENQKEPGPWNKAHDKKKSGKLFGKAASTSDLGFSIHIDEVAIENNANIFVKEPMNPPIKEGNCNIDKGFKYPSNFHCKNRAQSEWNTPVTIENEPDSRSFPQYNKCMLYPRPNMEFQIEELRAYNWFKRRGKSNTFTSLRDAVWSKRDICANIRKYPNFATRSRPQSHEALDNYFEPPKVISLIVDFEQIYDSKAGEEFQFEELMARRIKRNETIITTTDMEETICLPNDRVQRRKSFFPVRKTMAPKAKESISNLSSPPDRFVEASQENNSEEKSEEEIKEMNTNDCKKHLVDTRMSEELQTKKTFSEKNLLHHTNENINAPKFQPHLEESLNLEDIQQFEIYTDSKIISPVKSPSFQSKVTSDKEFEFKTPAAPTALKSGVKMPFTIYTETSPSTAQKTNIETDASNIDADETCCTQSFNIFLKAQSVSTPNAVQKVAARQFGTLLKDSTAVVTSHFVQTEHYEEQAAACPFGLNTDNRESVSIYSPQHKQLSTILEISEHGSTQGTNTHTTGASTKSTISSPETESASETQLVTGAGRITGTMPYESELKPLQELSHESSRVEAELDTLEIVDNLQMVQNKNNSPTPFVNDDVSGLTANLIATTPATRNGGGLNFSIYVDNNEPELEIKQAGNFTHLEQREDTTTCLSVRAVHFQEDKTETISKMLLPSRQEVKFQDDKTETISKMLITPATVAMSNFVIEDELKVPSNDDVCLEDSFECFVKTPPKMQIPKPKLVENAALVNYIEDRSPLASVSSKRFCDIDTPQAMSKIGLFTTAKQLKIPKDANYSLSSTAAVIPTLINDSFLKLEINGSAKKSFAPKENINNVSFIKDSQPFFDSKRKNLDLQFDNSLLNDFSKVMDSQPLQQESKWKKSNKLLTAKIDTEKPNYQVMMETYMNDFSTNNKPPGDKERETTKSMFLNNSSKHTGAIPKTTITTVASQDNSSFISGSSLKFLTSSSTKDEYKLPQCSLEPTTTPIFFDTSLPHSHNLNKFPSQSTSPDQSLELNAATQMFSTNSSLIKNSTWLPNLQIQENSLHIKAEAPSSDTVNHIDLETSYTLFKSPPLPSVLSKCRSDFAKDAELGNAVEAASYAVSRLSIDKNESSRKVPLHDHNNHDDNTNNDELSIYYKKTPSTPKKQMHSWDDSAECEISDNNYYVHHEVNLNHTQKIIANIGVDPNINPIKSDLIKAFLDEIDFSSYINGLDNCMLLGHVSRLNSTSVIRVHKTEFRILKLIGDGAYGTIYCGVDKKTGKKYAFKQERPPNYWEYYICLEVHSRLNAEEMHTSFMSIEYALIGNNSSILISPFSQYGSLIAVCNKIKKYTLKNVDEYVVMYLTCELLEIVDHLHAVGIIHADIKADNILLMNKLSYPCTERSLQLIDFGVSIDIKRFKEGQTFSYVNKEDAFKCVEMREQRPWTFQLDLYGLAGVIHVLLFGKYIEVEKQVNGIWMHKTHVPRYLNKQLWNIIFKTILNVRDCASLPNLQHLRALLKEEIAEKEKYVINKILDFNRALEI